MKSQIIPAYIYEKAAAFTTEDIATIDQITDGAINETYLVETVNSRFILQKMSHIFTTDVMTNLKNVQPYTEAAGVLIPETVHTNSGDLHLVEEDQSWYRALKFVPGRTLHDHLSVAKAESAAALIGLFHTAMVDFEGKLVTCPEHYHDNPYYVEQLKTAMESCDDEVKLTTLLPLAKRALKKYDEYYIDVNTLPQRVVHADLKTSNIRFNDEGEAIALIDMDTMMKDAVLIEMGDGLRSWCGTSGEDDVDQVFDEEIAVAALSSYRSAAAGITKEEIDLIPQGIGLMTASLAIRFITDAFNENYFALSTKYTNLYEQNKTRGENQLRFLDAYEAKRHLLEQ